MTNPESSLRGLVTVIFLLTESGLLWLHLSVAMTTMSYTPACLYVCMAVLSKCCWTWPPSSKSKEKWASFLSSCMKAAMVMVVLIWTVLEGGETAIDRDDTGVTRRGKKKWDKKELAPFIWASPSLRKEHRSCALQSCFRGHISRRCPCCPHTHRDQQYTAILTQMFPQL